MYLVKIKWIKTFYVMSTFFFYFNGLHFIFKKHDFILKSCIIYRIDLLILRT